VLLVVSESDFDQFEPSLYWAHARRKLHRRGLLEIQVVAGSDHSLYTQRGKAIAYPLVIRWLTERFASQ